MTIKEIEELAGMPRANIRYYETEGLLSPTRSENGYRDYSKESREDMFPKVQAPWRRFFARMLDEAVYGTLWFCFLLLVFQIRLSNVGIGWTVVNTIAVLLLTMVLEPLQLSLFGTTLGKWILGLRVLDYYGGKLSFSYAFDRTKDVLWYGVGFSIPFYNLFRMWQCYVNCTDGKELEWEYGSRIILKDEKKYRIVICAAVYAILIGVNVYAELNAILPVHRGEMTLAEFCENYRRLEELCEVDSGYILGNDGKWTQRETSDNEIVVDLYGFGAPPDFIFELDDDGKIQKVSFVVEVNVPADTPSEERRWVSNYHSQMNLAVMAFIGIKEKPVDIINSHEYEGFEFAVEDVTVCCDMQWQGYEPYGGTGVFAPFDEGECSFYMEFTMSLEN